MQKIYITKLIVSVVLIVTIALSATLFIYTDRKELRGLTVMVLDNTNSVRQDELTYSDVDTTDGDAPDAKEVEEEIIIPTLPPLPMNESEVKPKAPAIVPPVQSPTEPVKPPEDEQPQPEVPVAPETPSTPPENIELPKEIVEEKPVVPEVPEVKSPAPIVNNELNADLNQYVLNIIKSYKIGNYPYLLNNDYMNYNGVTMNLYYQNKLLLKAHPSGSKASHCVGLTFEVMLRALQERNKKLGLSSDDINGMSYKDMYDMALIWFVSSGNKKTNNLHIAVEKYGIGKAIHNLKEAKAGDFIDISRENNTGHTGVFMNWIKEGDKIIGFRYWSTQTSTNGIDYRTEYFNVLDSKGKKYGNVMMDMVFLARINAVKEYKSIK